MKESIRFKIHHMIGPRNMMRVYYVWTYRICYTYIHTYIHIYTYKYIHIYTYKHNEESLGVHWIQGTMQDWIWNIKKRNWIWMYLWWGYVIYTYIHIYIMKNLYKGVHMIQGVIRDWIWNIKKWRNIDANK
jgi:hypothetical protein